MASKMSVSLLYTPPTSPPREMRVMCLLAQLPPLIIPRSSVPLREFTIFSKLPDHLRQRIWHFVAREPRYIKLIALNRHLPALYQTWDPLVPGQPRSPGILCACRESHRVGSMYYKRMFEKIQQRPEDKNLKWAGTEKELMLAKRASQLTNGTQIYVNLSSDIFVHVQCPATAHESRSENIHNYNFKPNYLQYIERIQQVYSEKNGMPFPLLLFGLAKIRDYGLELGEDSKETIKGLVGVERDIHMRQFRANVMMALLHFLGGILLRVPLKQWKVELR